MTDASGAPAGYRSVDPAEAERLVADGQVLPLDVRTQQEFERTGHIHGAVLVPVDIIPVAAATLRDETRPLLVYCEHGMRSVHAAQLLARAGFTGVLNMTGGMSSWRGPREHTPGDPFGDKGISSWIVENQDLLQGGAALDVACGAGRHALLLAAVGYSVRALDRDAEAIRGLTEVAERLALPIEARVTDLEAGGGDLGQQEHDLIVVVHYLHRPLFPALLAALRPGGLLLYETFTIHQAERGRPTRPEFLLQPGELRQLVAPLEVLNEREGEFDRRMVAAVAARKPRA